MKSAEYVGIWMDEAMDFMEEKGMLYEFNERLKIRLSTKPRGQEE